MSPGDNAIVDKLIELVNGITGTLNRIDERTKGMQEETTRLRDDITRNYVRHEEFDNVLKPIQKQLEEQEDSRRQTFWIAVGSAVTVIVTVAADAIMRFVFRT